MAATIDNPIISTTTTGAMGLKRPLKVTKVYYSPAAATNTFSITDTGGNVLVQSATLAATGPLQIDFVVPKVFPSNPGYVTTGGSDWAITSLTGGTLYIYWR